MSLVPDVVLVFEVNKERKELRYRKLPFSAWSELKASLGFTPTTLISAVGDFDLEAVGALIWLERKQRERNLRWAEVRRDLEREDYEFKTLGVTIDGEVILDEEEEKPEPEEEPDPTVAG